MKYLDFKTQMIQKIPGSGWARPVYDYVQNVLLGTVPAVRERSTTAAPSSLQIALWFGVLLASLVLFVYKYSEFQIGAYHDDATYIVLAQSLVHSDTYGLIDRPGEPGSTQFPFGFPLLLSPIVSLFPDNLDALRSISFMATLINISLLFWGWHWFSRRRSYWWGLAIAALFGLSPLVVDESRMVMSEPVFLTFCLVALLLAEQAAQHRESAGWVLWMGISLFFVLFIRTIGFTLVIPVFVYLFWKRGMSFLKSLLGVALVIVGLCVAIVLLTSVQPKDLVPNAYVNQFVQEGQGQVVNHLISDQLYKLTDQTGLYLWQLLIPFGGGQAEEQFFGSLGLAGLPTLYRVLVLGLTGLGLLAWIRQEGLSMFNLFPIFYLCVIYFWAWDGRRFLYPIQPELQFAFLLIVEAIVVWIAAHWLTKERSRRLVSAVIIALVALLLIGETYKSMKLDPTVRHVGDVYSRTSWLKENTGAMDIVMTEQPEEDFVNSGRRVVPFGSEYTSAEELQRDLMNNQVKYIIVAPALEWQANYQPVYSMQTEALLPLLETLMRRNHLVRVYSSPENLVQVLRVQP